MDDTWLMQGRPASIRLAVYELRVCTLEYLWQELFDYTWGRLALVSFSKTLAKQGRQSSRVFVTNTYSSRRGGIAGWDLARATDLPNHVSSRRPLACVK